uniref:EF-hand domain-containing protein n=4 Tax=Tetradesmus obliquus TaxID=3088 RepID=A0A383W6F7_TETOB|eukprot:jgi/Sobl393_1/16961/SZX72709.1
MSSIAVTPMSTKAWISLDCVLPRNDEVATNQVFYQIAAQLLLPLLYLALMLAAFLLYGIILSMRTKQPLLRGVIAKRLAAPIISAALCMLSYFYPSLAYTILGVFSCRYLDPSGDKYLIPGEELTARGWYWTEDLQRQCFVDPGHRVWALALGIPGTLALLAYPLLQGVILHRKAQQGQLTPTSDWFGSYGHLVEDFRPRLFYWGSIVELRKLVLVAVVLGLASTGVISQLVGCSLVLLGFAAATMGLLPYPYRVLNRLHLACAAVLLAVVWLNLFVAVGEEGGALSGGISGGHSLALQLLSVALVVAMVAVLLGMCGVMFYRKAVELLDADGDGRISWGDLQVNVAQMRAKGGLMGAVGKLLCCFGDTQQQQQQQKPGQQQRQQQQRQRTAMRKAAAAAAAKVSQSGKGKGNKGAQQQQQQAAAGAALTSAYSNVIKGSGGMMVIGGLAGSGNVAGSAAAAAAPPGSSKQP